MELLTELNPLMQALFSLEKANGEANLLAYMMWAIYTLFGLFGVYSFIESK